MALCGSCCAADEGKVELAPLGVKKADVGFNMPLDQALGGPGEMHEEEAVTDAKQRQEEEPPMTQTEFVSDDSVKIRPSEVFNIQIQKGDRKMYLDINFHDHKSLLVTKVNAGPVEEFNRANPDSELAPGDRIEVVNGAEGDTQSMLTACKTAPTLNMRVRRCQEKTITLRKGGGSSGLGFSWQIVDGMTLIITKVHEDGLVSEHNKAHPEHSIAAEDRIIGVNGVRSSAARLEAALDADSWELVLRRIWPEDEDQ